MCLSAVTALALAAGVLGSQASAVVYTGPPDLALTARTVAAGTEGGTFHAQTLFSHAFGERWSTEQAALTGAFGTQRVRDCFAVMDFTMFDALRLSKRDGVALPAASEGAQPLSEALWEAGQTPQGRYDVGYMLEHMVTHRYHHEIMRDLDLRFGHVTNASFHVVLTKLIADGRSKQ